jgi:hypothetical protein
MIMNDELDDLRKEVMVIYSVSLSDDDLFCVIDLALREGWKKTTDISK